MSDIWDDRKKSLEEEYFRRQEQEAIARMRAKREAERLQREAEGKVLACPKCDGSLVEINYENIMIDRCDKCNGVWLDAGELEQLSKREESSGFLSRMWQSISGK
ncbi:MAG TPA: zf-TFIIB domain-containing protein [Blastocatellia bacterium]|nr:zf-TFIIB domain-containing protein [Blastocatellia bacterium]